MRTVVWDIETTNLRSDIGFIIVASFAELDADGNITEIRTKDFTEIRGRTQALKEKRMAEWVKEQYEHADILIGHNSTAFDRHFLRGMCMRTGLGQLEPRYHIDTYQVARGKLLYQSLSLSNLADILGVGEKDKPDKDSWREANAGDKDAIKRLRVRCESDVTITAGVWHKLKPLYHQRKGS
jgi:uncharacterized protein YprB with RNaseH-like and TPR domain